MFVQPHRISHGLAALMVFWVGTLQAETPVEPERKLSETAPVPRNIVLPTKAEIDHALTRGVDFLLGSQHTQGWWGSATRTKNLNIYAPVPGSHHAFRSAVTAMCVSALVETGGDRADVAAAIDRGEAWMLENLPKLRRANGDALYNVWGHAYALEAFARLHAWRKDDPAKQAELLRQMAIQVELLGRYETVEGGWGYYDFKAQTQKPSGDANSFTTATVLIAFHRVSELGVAIPKNLVDRGLAVIKRQQLPNLSYLYASDFKFHPGFDINKPGGSVGRSQVCNLVLRLYGDTSVSDAAIKAWSDRLFSRNLWLDIGRKRPIPHEAWFYVAGYFFYYGHYYAAYGIDQLPESDRVPLHHQLARVMLKLQESDGSWWDYPLYDYHQPYGTAFALMTLKQCQPSAIPE